MEDAEGGAAPPGLETARTPPNPSKRWLKRSKVEGEVASEGAEDELESQPQQVEHLRFCMCKIKSRSSVWQLRMWSTGFPTECG